MDRLSRRFPAQILSRHFCPLEQVSPMSCETRHAMHHITVSHEAMRRLSAIEDRIQYHFANSSLLVTALTHSSWANEHNTPHNERLEFLGDAVLELCVSKELYDRFPHEREGMLTHLRSRMVGEEKLAELARMLHLGECMLMGRGEEAQGGRERPALIADAVEALLGAVYLDGGHAAATALVHRLYEKHWPTSGDDNKNKDYKTKLQEVTQALLHSLPVYVHLSSDGPEHARTFYVRLDLSNNSSFTASGGSIKRAEQEAARLALEALAGERSSS